jgi:hypothetical protein
MRLFLIAETERSKLLETFQRHLVFNTSQVAHYFSSQLKRFSSAGEDLHVPVIRSGHSPGPAGRNKEEAIRQVAAALAGRQRRGGYVDGMLAREQQTSTFLGNGIAIPHGTTDTRDQVLKTGVKVFQFPQGIPGAKGR